MKRSEAVSLGLMFYEADKQCSNGHPPMRYTSTGQCVECLKKRSRTTKVIRVAVPPDKEQHLRDYAAALCLQNLLDNPPPPQKPIKPGGHKVQTMVEVPGTRKGDSLGFHATWCCPDCGRERSGLSGRMLLCNGRQVVTKPRPLVYYMEADGSVVGMREKSMADARRSKLRPAGSRLGWWFDGRINWE